MAKTNQEIKPIAVGAKGAAKLLGVDISTIYLMVYNNKIPHTRTVSKGKRGQGKILFSIAELEKWLAGDKSGIKN